jgi:hypothetical protein
MDDGWKNARISQDASVTGLKVMKGRKKMKKVRVAGTHHIINGPTEMTPA